ncbi:MAG: transposase [Spirochaetota bacterium]
MVAHQTHGDMLRLNPHFHATVLDGGFDDEGTFFYTPVQRTGRHGGGFRAASCLASGGEGVARPRERNRYATTGSLRVGSRGNGVHPAADAEAVDPLVCSKCGSLYEVPFRAIGTFGSGRFRRVRPVTACSLLVSANQSRCSQ